MDITEDSSLPHGPTAYSEENGEQTSVQLRGGMKVAHTKNIRCVINEIPPLGNKDDSERWQGKHRCDRV